ncbi:hypothetical protein [Sphingomonas alba]|uniref:Uncharacterized protein n=1 Tax=Sphingomonas alba TaxID=2908208 RepID=A0ABT0RPR6_9SPHN|nr:hypothetical protein [Sphingomonas alba]MCL6684480.1 hypothetical protein [Sphingomonas alba]
MAAMFFGFVTVMAIGFAHPELVIPMAINFIFLIGFFGIPVLFVIGSPRRLEPGARRWSEFMRNGLITATGRTSGGEAVVLTLMLPFFIFCWAIVAVIIAALA